MKVPDRRYGQAAPFDHHCGRSDFSPKTWYGMPAYAKDGKGVVFLPVRGEVQREVRNVGVQRRGETRPGSLWPTSYALKELTATEEKKVAALVKKAAR